MHWRNPEPAFQAFHSSPLFKVRTEKEKHDFRSGIEFMLTNFEMSVGAPVGNNPRAPLLCELGDVWNGL